MAERKKVHCPILALGDFSDFTCMEQGCAWWNEAQHECRLVTISKALNQLALIAEYSGFRVIQVEEEEK